MTGSERARQYVDDVLAGRLDVPELVRLACQRFIDDLTRPEFVFDAAKADAAVGNIEQLPHVKGRWSGDHIKLEPWQCFWVASIFGWTWAETGYRRFRYAYAQIPRKNGKSLTAIAIALQFFAADDEQGAEVYLGATSEAQARDLLFLPTRRMVETCPQFRKFYGIEVNASTLVIGSSFSRLKSVIRKPDDGYNPHCAVVDEYHEHETDAQWSTFDTGMGSREQPLLLTVTTAGSNLGGPCKEYRDDCERILKSGGGDSTFALIYEPDETDAWDDPATLRKVNPNIGVSVSEAYLLDQLDQARRSASKQNAFRTKHLNQWVGAKVAWMNMLAWQRQKRAMDPEQYRARPAYLGIDLASKKDVAAVAVIVPDGDAYATFQWYYAPEAAALDNEKYRELATAGVLALTPGSATDYGEIEAKLEELAALFDIRQVGFDQWQAQYLAQRLMERGLPMTEFPHQVRTFSDPMKEIEALVLDRRLWHDGNKATTWMMGNVMGKADAKENIYPTRSRPHDPACKIDGVVAMVMAMGLAMRARETGTIDDWLNNPVAM